MCLQTCFNSVCIYVYEHMQHMHVFAFKLSFPLFLGINFLLFSLLILALTCILFGSLHLVVIGVAFLSNLVVVMIFKMM